MKTKHFKMLIEPVNTDKLVFILWVTIEPEKFSLDKLKLNLVPINKNFIVEEIILYKHSISDYLNISSTIFNFVVGYIPADISEQTREAVKKFSKEIEQYIKG